MEETVITKEGLARLSADLERLRTEGRRRIAARLEHAATTAANVAENSDYVAARDEQALLERRIALLEDRLRGARVAEPAIEDEWVDVGERVRLRDLDSGERLEIELVGPLESDAAAGRISIVSPLGRAVLGRRRGDVAEVDAPRGRRRLKILAVQTPAAGAA